MKKLGSRIVKLRESRGLSQAEVARRLYMERGNYSRIETGKTNPSIITLHKIAEVLEVDVKEMID
ncbi:helix-turn-helix transcriptional regulator [Ekhidna sp.]|uniref:helix-turn-helix domain-containing protein n=1 Tax=Ekhidna sp. TaxID=2608089 RepID=UPI00329A1849